MCIRHVFLLLIVAMMSLIYFRVIVLLAGKLRVSVIVLSSGAIARRQISLRQIFAWSASRTCLL